MDGCIFRGRFLRHNWSWHHLHLDHVNFPLGESSSLLSEAVFVDQQKPDLESLRHHLSQLVIHTLEVVVQDLPLPGAKAFLHSCIHAGTLLTKPYQFDQCLALLYGCMLEHIHRYDVPNLVRYRLHLSILEQLTCKEQILLDQSHTVNLVQVDSGVDQRR